MNPSTQGPLSLPRPQYSQAPSAASAPAQPIPQQQQPQPPPQYELFIVQQPDRGKVVVKNREKDRRPIDPPPIIQVVCRYDNSPCSFHHNPYLFCYASLWDEAEDRPKTEDPSGLPLLVGYTSSSMHRLKDLTNAEGAFFVFGDLAATVTGKARLHFSLFEVKPAEGVNVLLKTIVSNPMDVQSARDWEGTKESTMLSRSFSEQGVKLRLRKESRAASRRSVLPQSTHMPPLHSTTHVPTSLRPTLPPMQHLQGGYNDDGVNDERDTKRVKTNYPGASMTPGSSTPTQASSSASLAGYQPQHYSQMQSQAYYASPQGYNMAYSSPGYPPQYGAPQGYPYPHAQSYARAMPAGYAPQTQGTPPQQQQPYQQPPPQSGAVPQHQPPPGATSQQPQSAQGGYPASGSTSQPQPQAGYPSNASASYGRPPYSY